jgi:uncharacterized OB-fold protein
MLETVRGDVVGEREQEVVVAIVPRAEQRVRLGDEPAVVRDVVVRYRERRLRIGRQVEVVSRRLTRRELDRLEVRAGEHRRVDQHDERGRLKDDRIRVRPLDG